MKQFLNFLTQPLLINNPQLISTTQIQFPHNQLQFKMVSTINTREKFEFIYKNLQQKFYKLHCTDYQVSRLRFLNALEYCYFFPPNGSPLSLPLNFRPAKENVDRTSGILTSAF